MLAGLVERVTYQNADNGFCVIRVKGHLGAVAIGVLRTATPSVAELARRRRPRRRRPDPAFAKTESATAASRRRERVARLPVGAGG